MKYDDLFFITTGYENLSTVSVSDPAALDVDIWEPSCSTIDICQKLQKEYTKKIEARHFMYSVSCVCG